MPRNSKQKSNRNNRRKRKLNRNKLRNSNQMKVDPSKSSEETLNEQADAEVFVEESEDWEWDYEDYRVYHNKLEEYRVKAQSDLDTNMLKVSLPALAFTIVIPTYMNVTSPIINILILISCTMLLIGVISTLLSYFYSVNDCICGINELNDAYLSGKKHTNEDVKWANKVVNSNRISLCTTVFGLILVVITMWFSLGIEMFPKVTTEKSKTDTSEVKSMTDERKRENIQEGSGKYIRPEDPKGTNQRGSGRPSQAVPPPTSSSNNKPHDSGNKK